MRHPILLVLVSSSMILGAAAAYAQAPAASSAAPASTTGAVAFDKGKNPYSAKVMKGHQAYVARDYPGAVAAYKDAIKDDAGDPTTHYFLGEAQLAAGNVAEADQSFATGLRSVGGKDDLRAKLLFVIADLRERQGKWADAKKAWDEYAQFVSSHAGVKGYIATATERLKVIDARADIETKYAPVKQRIEQRLKEVTAPPPDDGPQGPSKKK